MRKLCFVRNACCGDIVSDASVTVGGACGRAEFLSMPVPNF